MSAQSPLEDRLVELLYGELEPAEAERLEAELAAHPQTAQRLAAWRSIRRAADEIPALEPDPQTHYNILRAARAALAESEQRPGGLLAWLGFGGLRFAPAMAAVGVAVLAVGSFFLVTREDGESHAPAGIYADAPKGEAAKVEPTLTPATAADEPAPRAKAEVLGRAAGNSDSIRKTAKAPAESGRDDTDLAQAAPEAAPVVAARPRGAIDTLADTLTDGSAGGAGRGDSNREAEPRDFEASKPRPKPQAKTIAKAKRRKTKRKAGPQKKTLGFGGLGKKSNQRAETQRAETQRAETQRAETQRVALEPLVVPADASEAKTVNSRGPNEAVEPPRARDSVTSALAGAVSPTPAADPAPVAAPTPAPTVQAGAPAQDLEAAAQNDRFAPPPPGAPARRPVAEALTEAEETIQPSSNAEVDKDESDDLVAAPRQRARRKRPVRAARGRATTSSDEDRADGAAVVRQARRAMARGEFAPALANLGRYSRQNPQDGRFAKALFQTAVEYEARGDRSRAMQLFRLVAGMGGPLSRRAAKHLAGLRAQRAPAKE